jgi:protein TonB
MSAATVGFESARNRGIVSPMAVAAVFSVVLHATLLVWAPMWQADALEVVQKPLIASLEAAPPPDVLEPPAPQPPQPAPQVKPPEPTPKPKRRTRTEPRLAPVPAREELPTAAPVAEAPSTPAPTEAVVAAPPSAPVVEAGQAVVAPEPVSIAQYQLALNVAAKKYRDYPRYARSREWEGRVTVRLDIGADGRAQQIRVTRSSGHELLDNTALEMLRKAQLDTPVPDALRARSFIVEVAVLFELKD